MVVRGLLQAYFGQKDAMQCVIIKQMVEDLNQPVEPVICPTSQSVVCVRCRACQRTRRSCGLVCVVADWQYVSQMAWR